LLKRGLQDYISSQRPQVYLFEGNNCDALSQRGTQWALSQAVKKAGIIKADVSLHTLRHSFATHLLEQGVSILLIKELLGHAHINTTMIYLHLARPLPLKSVSILDTLYGQGL
jgi:site-specific recombinase XerD